MKSTNDSFDEAHAPKVTGSVMVVGGGIAGVQASLDLADSGYYVYLVEKSPAIGGVMAALDKTFPTNDCAMCIFSPKLVECGRHINIELLTWAEVERVTGEEGNFEVIIRKQPRYVDLNKCTACGECADACPVTVPSEFDEGLATRKAAFKYYPQAIPSGYAIEKLDLSPCTNACPNHVNAHAYVALIGKGKYKEAMDVILRNLPFPGVIGRICPHPCESACRRGEVDEPVSICALKRFVADQVDIEDLPIPEIEKRDEKVAIIGAGPAGLTAAHCLALAGYQVTVFEALPVAGGMLRVGIPDYRLPPEVLEKEIRAITRLGVDIRFNTAFGGDITMDELRAQGFKAIYLAIGAHKSMKLNIAGEDAKGVTHGVDFLRQVNLREITKIEGNAVIVGGGDVAIDAARCALRVGAEKVTILYRRSREEMPARENEIEDALAEDIEIQYLTAPQQILTKEDQVVGIECVKMELGEPDSSGRRRPVRVPGSEFIVETNLAIPAIGQTPDSSFLAETAGVALSRFGTIEANEITFATNVEGVFAGGDAQTGPWVAIGAVAAGREAAISISRYLKGEDLSAGREPVELPQENFRAIPKDMEKTPRAKMSAISGAERKTSFAEVEQGLTEEQAKAEAERCLNCMTCCECYQCVEACKAEAIDHSMQPETVTLEVGSIIAAPGFKSFDPSRFDTYAYASHPNVVTSMEFERILNAGGPYQGHLIRPSDHKEPEKIAWLQCVGSRDINRCDNAYCSAVCCMYAIKEAVIAREHSKEPLDTAIFFMDMRTPGKDFDKYYERAKETGVRFVRSRVHTIDPVPETGNLRMSYATEEGRMEEEEFDMVVLSVGLESPPAAKELAEKLGIELDDYRFVRSSAFTPVGTSRPGIYACGVFQEPKDIPLSVMEASAAACAASAALSSARGSMTRKKAVVKERDISGEGPRIGVFVCHCGINIGGVVNVPEVREYARTLPFVEYAGENLFTCSQDTQEKIREVIKEHGLNRVVVASCTPRTHEPMFQETIMEAGLNKYLFEMANIRDQCSWVHRQLPEAATEKAKDLVRMAVAKAAIQQPLKEFGLQITRAGLVIGGGIAGMEAALGLADQGFGVHLVEKKEILGGHGRNLSRAWTGEPIGPYLDGLISRVENHSKIDVHLNSDVTEVEGFVGNFKTTISTNGSSSQVEHGVAIIATGGHAYKPTEYLYKKHPNVFLSLELDEALQQENRAVTGAKSALFIQCVGSREPERPYCSRVCCTHSIESALKLKEIDPEMEVFILYRDMRTYGLRENLYQEAREKGVVFIRYDLDHKPQVEQDSSGGLKVTVLDPILQRPIVLYPEIITLASAIVVKDQEGLAMMFKVPINAEGFFLEAHMKLRPVDFATDGVFVAGLAHYPKPTEECIAQAKAAVARAVTVLAQEEIRAGGVVSQINEELCAGCQACIRVCPFGAIDFVEDRQVCQVNPGLCKGCGSCTATCLSECITLMGFSNDQIYTQIDEALAA